MSRVPFCLIMCMLAVAGCTPDNRADIAHLNAIGPIQPENPQTRAQCADVLAECIHRVELATSTFIATSDDKTSVEMLESCKIALQAVVASLVKINAAEDIARNAAIEKKIAKGIPTPWCGTSAVMYRDYKEAYIEILKINIEMLKVAQNTISQEKPSDTAVLHWLENSKDELITSHECLLDIMDSERAYQAGDF